MNDLPVDLACEAILRSGSQERLLTRFACSRKEKEHRFSAGAEIRPVFTAPLELVFRYSEAVQNMHPELDNVWKGEIVFDDVYTLYDTGGTREH